MRFKHAGRDEHAKEAAVLFRDGELIAVDDPYNMYFTPDGRSAIIVAESRKRLDLIEQEITRLEKEYADLDEVWQAEKAMVQGTQHIMEEIDKVKLAMEDDFQSYQRQVVKNAQALAAALLARGYDLVSGGQLTRLDAAGKRGWVGIAPSALNWKRACMSEISGNVIPRRQPR